MSAPVGHSSESLDAVLARLAELDRELAGPDLAHRILTNDILRTYPRRGGTIVLNLTDEQALARRKVLHERRDENNSTFGPARAERARLIARKRALKRAEESGDGAE